MASSPPSVEAALLMAKTAYGSQTSARRVRGSDEVRALEQEVRALLHAAPRDRKEELDKADPKQISWNNREMSLQLRL
jgi:hypothetical protein